jgi:S-ribosylhomocysteine lyase LuxS involved in autoinducer biosynthesis
MAKPTPIFSMSLQELEKVIGLIRGIMPDVETMPTKATHKIEHLARFFEAHRERLEGNNKKK